MIKDTISKLVERENLTAEESVAAMEEIMSGEATPAQLSAFITALRMKGETAAEVTGCARAMRSKVTPIDPGDGAVIDTCGTGGDAKFTFNVSTAAAFVAAGAGLKVAKHGNRSVSSNTGSADVLKLLGVNLEADKAVVERCLREARIGFLFAPLLHPAMKFAIGPRREIGVRTIFNILGPLTNPAFAHAQLLGVFSGELTQMMAEVLKNLGSTAAMVVHGRDGLDEITTTAETEVCQLSRGSLRCYVLDTEAIGLRRARLQDLTVGAPEESAEALKQVLAGKPGPKTDITLANGAAALVVGGVAGSLEEGLEMARESVRAGAAAEALRKLVEISCGG